MNQPTPKLIALRDYGAEFVHAQYGALLQRIRRMSPSAVLVGGAVRDTIFGREVKDLDFMVLSDADVSGIERALSVTVSDVLGFDRMQGRSEYDEDANVYRVFETEDKRINILHVGDITSRVITFPDSISQIIFDGAEVYVTQRFIDTARTHVITHSHEPQRELKAERRERIAAKYPDFEFKDIV
jgi:hypothetical protein